MGEASVSIDLQKFCGRDVLRSSIHKPFSQGAWTYATDGHVAVRVPRRADIPEQSDPDADKLFATMFRADAFAPFDAIKMPKRKDEDCPHCAGRLTEHSCPSCACVCARCDGTGLAVDLVTVGINGAIFNAKFVLLIQSLPGLEFASGTAPNDPMPFRFDGGEGLVMPMHGQARIHVDAIAKATGAAS